VCNRQLAHLCKVGSEHSIATPRFHVAILATSGQRRPIMTPLQRCYCTRMRIRHGFLNSSCSGYELETTVGATNHKDVGLLASPVDAREPEQRRAESVNLNYLHLRFSLCVPEPHFLVISHCEQFIGSGPAHPGDDLSVLVRPF
jgi:hypothetical protein